MKLSKGLHDKHTKTSNNIILKIILINSMILNLNTFLKTNALSNS